eukprot:TRINITY_DN30863_c0_g1_i3.p1 TRINITY_DN30863_c0_g1~~TRINITY_DN30863_c0_g1_i3.p1  ORF type:complete len:168 (-),score=31.57 TRINITY_DN30863_c0_g1_i3:250-753(-)
MHGALVAYHNTEQIYGFQYIPLTEIDKCVYGSSEMADLSFHKGTELLSNVIGTVRQSCDLSHAKVVSALHRGKKANYLDVYVDPEFAAKKREVNTVTKFRIELERTLDGIVLGPKEVVDFEPGNDLQVSYKISSAEFKTNLLRQNMADMKKTSFLGKLEEQARRSGC